MENANELVMLEALLYAMEGESPSKAIENQEKREPQKVVRYLRLPKRGNAGIPYNDRKNNLEFTRRQYEKMGIKILEDANDLFYAVELPDGWEIKPTKHSMWNEVVDDKGRVRISFFYEGTFYDRDAFSNFERRYDYAVLPFDNYETNATYEERNANPWKLWITDNNMRVYFIEERTVTSAKDKWKMHDELDNVGEKYMNEHYPDWKDINAYWD